MKISPRRKNDQALNGILTYVMFAAALAGVIFGVLLLLKKGPGATIDWIVIITCVASGLVVYLSALNDRKIELQNGAYLILVGWIVALVFQILSMVKKER